MDKQKKIRTQIRAFLMASFSVLVIQSCNKSNPSPQPVASAPNTGNPYTQPDPGYNRNNFPNETPGPYNQSTTPSTADDFSGGDTVVFYPVSLQVMNSFVGTQPLNKPTNIKLNVNVSNIGGSNRYGGTVQLVYDDAGQHHNDRFSSGVGRNYEVSGLNDNNTLEAIFNSWFTYKGVKVFNGFFQDQFGSIVLTIDKSSTTADAEGSGLVSGNVWYRNFAQGFATQSPYRKCWFITSGTYNCQSYSVMFKTSPYPSNGYVQLGSFKGLSKKKAFNLN